MNRKGDERYKNMFDYMFIFQRAKRMERIIEHMK